MSRTLPHAGVWCVVAGSPRAGGNRVPWPVLDGVSRAALDPGLVAFGSTLRLVADEDRLPERDLLASARLTPPT